MDIDTLIDKDIIIEIDGAKMTFYPSSHQDMLFAMSLLDYLKGDEAKETPIDKDKCIKHVFLRLKAVEGVKISNDDATVEKLREVALKIPSRTIIPIVTAWAIHVAKDHGFIESSSDSKKD